jgi:DNA-binding transcriptional regulator YiaG
MTTMSSMRGDDLVLIASAARMLADGTAKRIRETSGLSQAQIAAACGVTHGAVSLWEAGERMPRTTAALRYARLLDRLAHVSVPQGV